MRLYYTAGPNEVMIITGGPTRTVTEPDGTKRQIGYRVKIGGGAFVIPWLESVSILPLDVFTVRLKVEKVFAANNVLITAEGQAQVKVNGDEPSIRLASEHFLGKGGEAIQSVAEEVIAGYMRAVVGTRTIEDIIRSQEEMAAEVLQGAGNDLGRMGLNILSFAFKEITDEQGFISALAEPRIAQVKRDALIARAEAEKDATVRTAQLKQEGDLTKLRSEEEVLEATAQFEIKRAAEQAEVNQHRAKADVAYDLQRTEIARQLKEQEAAVQLLEKQKAIELQEQEIVRREKELEASVKRPAEAHSYQARLEAEIEAYRKELEGKGRAAWIRVEGEAEAQAIRAKGEAEAASMAARAESYRRYNQAALVEMFVKVLPEVARAVSEPLSKVEKIVMVGGGNGDGGVAKLTSQIAQAVAQVPVVVETLTGINLNRLLDGFMERGGAKAIEATASEVSPSSK